MKTYIYLNPKGSWHLLLLLVLLLCSCVNLQHVSDYATTSTTQLKTYDALGYSFSQACDDACGIMALRDLQLMTTDCHCAADSTADSVTTVICKGLKTYFDALSKLSGKETGKYKTSGFSKSLQAGSFGSVTITKPQATAYTQLAGLITDVIAGFYKHQKVREYINTANAPVQELLQALAFNIRDNLGGKLKAQQARLQSLYFDLANDSVATQYERTKAIQDYHATAQTLKTKAAELEVFAKGLDKLAKGHQKLYEERERLTLAACKAVLTEYSDQVNDLVDAFNKLKNNH
ncbi:hypothetical protein GA0116948_10698 [Chitinophaga costaii]|uniref:Uncharacterized protein n=1 Tax=Chitinophaga costaii TaxID=1335309 RepID=A0A1C4DTE0_9BACT|nr:hypothetical protein [Chitinophaga costaii]PUZ27781.1 hypothetical protein DCM91_06125 [Chitinophaga costaii]SCC34609.1 hypothetical protein GA0116948_10698 [Chitinophaga costaii]